MRNQSSLDPFQALFIPLTENKIYEKHKANQKSNLELFKDWPHRED